MASKVCNTPLVFLVLSLKNVLQVFLALLLINFRSLLNITKSQGLQNTQVIILPVMLRSETRFIIQMKLLLQY